MRAAYFSLFADGPLADRDVLVTGGAGAVGIYALQFAKLAGAKSLMTTVSNEAKAPVAAAAVPAFLGALRTVLLAESLGGVESLIAHPSSMTHADIPAKEQGAVGLTPKLVRLSVGIEDANDLCDDLDQALLASRGGTRLMARSLMAVIDSDGLTPGLAEIIEPSQTYRLR